MNLIFIDPYRSAQIIDPTGPVIARKLCGFANTHGLSFAFESVVYTRKEAIHIISYKENNII